MNAIETGPSPQAMIACSLSERELARRSETLQGLGVKYHEKVDKESFIALARPLQDPQAQDLGPYAVQLLKFIRNVK